MKFGHFLGSIFLGRKYFDRATFELYGLEIGHLAASVVFMSSKDTSFERLEHGRGPMLEFIYPCLGPPCARPCSDAEDPTHILLIRRLNNKRLI
jgi:hypothetical protein